MMQLRKVILASNSPRRKEILSESGIKFDVELSEVDENINDSGKKAHQITEILADKKGLDVAKNHIDKDVVIIAADTLVTINNKIFGKPSSSVDAKLMLEELSGHTHFVITSIFIYDCLSKNKHSDTSFCKVTFEEISDEEILDYIDTKEPFDKAGAYAIQGKAAKYIKSIEGDYYSIVGLPISKVYKTLKSFNVLG